MGIVTSGAGQSAFALNEALRLSKAVCGADDLKLIVCTDSRRMIEEQLEGAKLFTGLVAKRRTVEAANGIGQWKAGGFQMALHTNFHTALRGKPLGVDDGCSYRLNLRVGQLRGAHMILARTMAALTIDAFRQSAFEDGLTSRIVVPCGDRGISVVTEHAVIADPPTSRWMAGVETGVECIHAAFFGIPGQRELDECISGCAMKIGPDVVARAHDVVDFLLPNAFFGPLETNLPSALIVACLFLDDLEPCSGGAMKIRLGIGETFLRRRIECARHARVPVRFVDIRMAAYTGAGVDVTIRGQGGLFRRAGALGQS